MIEKLESSLRDENHRVVGGGASEKDSKDAYRWVFTERITIPPEHARNLRYAGIEEALQNSESATKSEKIEAEVTQ